MLQIIQRGGTAEAIISYAQANVPIFLPLYYTDYHTPMAQIKLTVKLFKMTKVDL
jgi:hypothetical protein